MSTATPPQRQMMSRPAPQRSGGSPGGLTTTIDPIRVLRRHVWWIVLAGLVGIMVGVASFVLLRQVYPLYSAEVIFEIQPGVSESQELGAREIASDQLASRLANTETVLLLDPTILRVAVRHPDVRQTQWFQKFRTISADGNEVFSIEDAVDDLIDSLSATVIRGTNFFRLGWRSHHASDVPVVLNSIANAYRDRRKDMSEAVWLSNIDVFTTKLNETTRALDDLDHQIRAFIRERGITSLTDPRYSQASIGAEAITQEIGRVTSQLNLSQGMLMQVAAKLVGTIEPSSEDIQEAHADPQVSSQMQMVTSLKSELRSGRERWHDRHPHVLEMESRLRAAELEMQAKIDEVIKRNLEARHKRIRDQIENMRDHLDKMQAEAEAKDAVLRDLAADQAQYMALESRRERLEAQRENDLSLIQEINLIRAREDAARVRIAQQAQLPREMSFPRVEIIVPLGVLLVTGLTIGFIFLREITDQRIKSASDLTVVPNANVLGVIPELDEDPTNSGAAELVVAKHPRSVLAESYRQACTSISRAAERNGHQTILLVAGLPGSGTTTAITNIAASLAASGKSVVVVDANFRRPQLAKAMGVSSDAVGLGDLLVGESSVDEVIQSSEFDVKVISAGTPGNRVFERLNNGRFDNIIAELRSKFDVVLFDAPPAVVAGDAMVLANRVDAAVLVVRANQEQRGLVARLIHQLSDARCEGLGILLNRPRRTAGGYFKKNFEAMASYSAKG